MVIAKYQEFINSFLENLIPSGSDDFVRFIYMFKNQMFLSRKIISSLFLISNEVDLENITKNKIYELLCVLLFEHEINTFENSLNMDVIITPKTSQNNLSELPINNSFTQKSSELKTLKCKNDMEQDVISEQMVSKKPQINLKFLNFELFKNKSKTKRNRIFFEKLKLDNLTIVKLLSLNKYSFFSCELQFSENEINKDVKSFIESSIESSIGGDNDYIDSKIENIKNFKIIIDNSYVKYINTINLPLFNMAFNSDVLAFNFAHICKIENDVSNILDEIVGKKDYSINYWINCGIRKTYEKYIECKTNILSEIELNNDSSKNDVYRIILHHFDEKIEKFINNTNPDICSTIASLS
jgi:hypothetical protein